MFWTKEETETLRRTYKPRDPSRCIKELPNRTACAIKTKAHELGISRPFDESLEKSIEKLDKTNCAYLAGLIDGDGTITMLKTRAKGNSPHYVFKPIIQISNTSKELIERINSLIPSRVNFIKQTGWGKNLYQWALGKTKSVQSLCKRLLPYLILKKPHAGIIIEFCKSRLEQKGRREYTQLEHKLFLSVRELNESSSSRA